MARLKSTWTAECLRRQQQRVSEAAAAAADAPTSFHNAWLKGNETETDQESDEENDEDDEEEEPEYGQEDAELDFGGFDKEYDYDDGEAEYVSASASSFAPLFYAMAQKQPEQEDQMPPLSSWGAQLLQSPISTPIDDQPAPMDVCGPGSRCCHFD
jgi:hypothetical protein